MASIAGACTRSIYFRHWKKRLGPLLETSTVTGCSQAQCTWKLAGKIWRIDPSNGYWRKWRWFIGGFGCTLLSKNWNCRVFSVGIFPKFPYLPFLRSQRVPVFLVGRLTLRAPCPRKLANIAWCRGCAAKCRCTFLAKLKSWRTPSRGNWNQALWSVPGIELDHTRPLQLSKIWSLRPDIIPSQPPKSPVAPCFLRNAIWMAICRFGTIDWRCLPLGGWDYSIQTGWRIQSVLADGGLWRSLPILRRALWFEIGI